MSAPTQDELNDIIDEMANEGYEFYTDYSGRGMYGDTCLAVDLDHTSDLMRLGCCLGRMDSALAHTLGEGAHTDSMGRGIVVYWPRIKTNTND